MKLPLLLAAGLVLSLVAVAPTASALWQCNFWIPPTENGGVVWNTYDYAVLTGYDAACVVGPRETRDLCRYALGDTCG